MPGRDRTGVMGHGMRSGRGLGDCKVSNDVRSGIGLGQGYRRGIPNFAVGSTESTTQKELLQGQKELFERSLKDKESKENL